MGERGPLPLPYARRRGKRPSADKRLAVAAPEMPEDFSDEARAEWERLVPELEQMGMLTMLDRALLVRFCTAWSDWCEVNEMLRATGKLIRARYTLVRNPLLTVRGEIEATLSDLAKQLNLTPASRLRAGVVHEAPDVENERPGLAAIEEYRRRLEEPSA